MNIRRRDYMVLKGVIPEKLEQDLNELGREGWEMVGFGVEDGPNSVVIFKRAIEQ